MSYFAEAKENQRFAPSIQGKLVVIPTHFSQDVKIEVSEDTSLMRLKSIFGLIVSYLDFKSLVAFHASSKVVQYYLNEDNCRPAAIIYQPDVISTLGYYQLSLLQKSIQHARLYILDLSQCSENLVLLSQLVKYIPKNLKQVNSMNLSKASKIEMPQIPGYLSLCREYLDTRSDADLLNQENISGVPVHELLKIFLSMSSLKTLSLDNQFLDYRLRDLFKRELKDIQVSMSNGFKK